MCKVNLKRLIVKKEVAAILEILTSTLGKSVAVQDACGETVFGDVGQHGARHPVRVKDKVVGWAVGDRDGVEAFASLLSHLVAMEVEKKALGRETLEKYKEVSALSSITEKLAANLDPIAVSKLVIEEVKALIKAENVSIMLTDTETGVFEIMAASDEGFNPMTDLTGKGIISHVFRTGKGEIVNDLTADPRYVPGSERISSLICVPLKIKDEVFGVINVTSSEPKDFTARDLQLLSTLAFQAAAAIQNARLYNSLKEAMLNTIHSLVMTIGKRDAYTWGHTIRVKEYSMVIAKEMGLSEEEMERLQLAAALHDIGKIGIRDSVLQKDGWLSDEEYAIIKQHTIYGEEIIQPNKFLRFIIPGIRHHHERYDGTGYPDRLQGGQIDLIARIIAVADAFDAMTTERPYRKILSYARAVDELQINAGTQFDPDVVQAFIKVIAPQINGKRLLAPGGSEE